MFFLILILAKLSDGFLDITLSYQTPNPPPTILKTKIVLNFDKLKKKLFKSNIVHTSFNGYANINFLDTFALSLFYSIKTITISLTKMSSFLFFLFLTSTLFLANFRETIGIIFN